MGNVVTVWFWRIPADWGGSDVLNAAELDRASAYVTPELRRQYEASVYFRRRVLGDVLNLPPEEVKFEVDARGKPALVAAQNPGHWEFSLAHSAEVMLLAVALGRAVGVDVEQVRSSVNWRGVAQTAFSEAEQHKVVDLCSFYSLWTAKEAYLKACGEGLGASLQEVTVEIRGEHVHMRLPLPHDLRQWWGWSFRPSSELHAAVVVQRQAGENLRPSVYWHALE